MMTAVMMTGDDDCVYNTEMTMGAKGWVAWNFNFGVSQSCVKSSTQGMVWDLGFSLNLNQTLFWFKFYLPTFFSLFVTCPWLCQSACVPQPQAQCQNCQNHFCFED